MVHQSGCRCPVCCEAHCDVQCSEQQFETSIELPPVIKSLIGRCEIGECSFNNDAMSLALKFGEMLHRRLLRFAEHYERRSQMYMPRDIRAACDLQASKDMRAILSDTFNDFQCEHRWVDARNEHVRSGFICLECGAIKPTDVGNA